MEYLYLCCFLFLSERLYGGKFLLRESMEEGGDGEAAFPLPFQWDDGVFISPFVATDPDTISGLASLVGSAITRNVSSATTSLLPHVITLLDLGCGDGRVVLEAAEAVAQSAAAGAYGPQVTVRHVSALGLDLDEALIDRAKLLALNRSSHRSAAGAAVGDPSLLPKETTTISYRFEVQDLLQLTAEACVAMAVGPSPPSCEEGHDSTKKKEDLEEVKRIVVVFAYLLPEALKLLEPLISQLLPRVTCVVSNRWDIPYLEPWRAKGVHPADGCSLNVYSASPW